MKQFLVLLSFLLILSAAKSSQGWDFVPDYGDTGWRTYSYQADQSGFTGTVGFVVSNVIDNLAYSELLVDNLSYGGDLSNAGFERGTYSGFTSLGDSFAELTTSVMAYNGKVYTATQGDYFSHQCCLDTGVSTAAFQNANHQRGTIGSILETTISLPAGSRFTFDWAFLAGDQSPWNDFALFYLKDTAGKIVFSAGLAQIGRKPADLAPIIGILISGIVSLLGRPQLALRPAARQSLAGASQMGRPGRGWRVGASTPIKAGIIGKRRG